MKSSPGITDPTRTITIPFQYDDDLLKQVSDEIQQIVLRSGTSDPIHININSIGGSPSSALALSQLFTSLPTPITTWGQGVVGGDALLLLASGTKERILLDGTTILASFHAPLPKGLRDATSADEWAIHDVKEFHSDITTASQQKILLCSRGACAMNGHRLVCFDAPYQAPLADRLTLQLLTSYAAALEERTAACAKTWFEHAAAGLFINPQQCVDLGIVDTISQLHGSASYQPLHKSRVGKCTG